MTATDRKQEELESQGSAAYALARRTVLGIALLRLQYGASFINPFEFRVIRAETKGSTSAGICLQVTEIDVMRQFHRVYDLLLSSQRELDPDSRVVLYDRLSELYS